MLVLSGPVVRVRPVVAAGETIAATHHAAPHPVRAALMVGDETWVAGPAGVLRFDASLWRAPERARPVGTIGLGEGLPALAANALLAHGGAVLVGTDGGLVELDRRGRQRGAVGLAGRRVTSLAPGYAGTWDGLYRWPGGTQVADGIAVTDLRSCHGRLYIATQEHGLLTLRGRELVPVAGVPLVRVGRLAGCGRSEALWAATTAGLFIVDGERARPAPGWRSHATTVATAGRSLLVGGFGDGLVRLAGAAPEVLLERGRISFALAGPDGRTLAATDDALLVIAPSGRARVPLDGPPPGLVTALASDGDGRLCAGTFDAGVACLEQDAWRTLATFEPRTTGLVFGPDGRLWVGTASGLGVEEGTRIVPARDPLGWLERHVGALRRDGDRLWAAVFPGLVEIDLGHGRPRHRYWGARGHETQLAAVRPRAGVEIRGSLLPGPRAYAIAPDGDALWVGTDDGLARLDAAGARTLTDLGGVLPDNWVNDARLGSGEGRRTLWALTLRSGLLRIRLDAPGGTEVWATDLMTGPSALLAVGDQALFGTNAAGLVVVDTGRSKGDAAAAPRLRSHGPAQGLPSTMVSALALDDRTGRLWVGGTAGVTRIDDAHRTLRLGAHQHRRQGP